MPAGLPPEEHIKVAQLDNQEDVAYREHLVQSYGKYKQMVSGIHYNFQIDPKFIDALFHAQNETQSAVDFQNNFYLKNSEELLTLPMDFTLLVFCNTDGRGKYFRDNSLKPHQYVRSLRSGKYGYVNDPKIHVSYDSLQEYVETLEHWVKSGDLIAEKSFTQAYVCVVLKSARFT